MQVDRAGSTRQLRWLSSRLKKIRVSSKELHADNEHDVKKTRVEDGSSKNVTKEAYEEPNNDASTVTDVAAFLAAAEDVKQIIDTKGGVSNAFFTETVRAKSQSLALVKANFPGAKGGSDILEKVKPILERRGYTPENTLFAQSICPDEINHEEGDIPNLFADYLGEVFHLGGLAGIPFSGKTGFGAFSHHVPDGGHCFILMAPHIGLSESDEFGKYSRDGQACDGAACGAAVGAFGHCCSGKPMPDLDDPDDYQMNYITRQINKCKKKILSFEDENSRQTELVKQTHGVAKKMLDKIVSTNFGDNQSTLVILTGIQINMPRPFEDYFQPLSFEIRTKDGAVVDLMHETFGADRRVINGRTKGMVANKAA